MASLFFIGKFLNRNINVYNILFFTAFIILFFDPHLLYNPGFQFSFLALISIVYFCPKLDKIFYVSTFGLKSICQYMNVSISAQILVLPLSLYYFNSFSLYFWLSGIFVIPAAVLILSSGIALLVFSLTQLEYIAEKIIAPSLNLFLELFISIISKIEALPYGNLKNVWIEPYEVTSIFIVILFFTLFSYCKKLKYVRYSLLAGMVLISLNIYFTHIDILNTELTIYDQYGETKIDIFYEEKLLQISSIAESEPNAFVSHNNRLKHGIKSNLSNDGDISHFFSSRLPIPVLV